MAASERDNKPWRGWNTNDHDQEANPVCVVGAGFQRAVLNPLLPMSATKDSYEKNIIEKTFSGSGAEFPALNLLGPCLTNTDLNYVWANIRSISEFYRHLTEDIVKTYKKTFSNKPMGYLVECLSKVQDPASLLSTILGLELKKILALQYAQERLKLSDPLPCGLVKFLDATKTKAVTWISLNYDLALEKVLEECKCVGPKNWRYAFENLLEGQNHLSQGEGGHLIVKPHGSLNIWFNTVWESRSDPAKRDLHQVSFVDSKDRLKTCDFAKVGYVNGNGPAKERRPWVVGYLPDEMKDEHNRPGNFADAAHDLCKWNLTYAALVLQKASSLYILAYSMPGEDLWIWERLAALRRKDLPIHVASGSDTPRITSALKSLGFTKTKKLSDDGFI